MDIIKDDIKETRQYIKEIKDLIKLININLLNKNEFKK